MTGDRWQVTDDTWQVTDDTWHVTSDTLHMMWGEHSLKILAIYLKQFGIYNNSLKIWRTD